MPIGGLLVLALFGIVILYYLFACISDYLEKKVEKRISERNALELQKAKVEVESMQKKAKEIIDSANCDAKLVRRQAEKECERAKKESSEKMTQKIQEAELEAVSIHRQAESILRDAERNIKKQEEMLQERQKSINEREKKLHDAQRNIEQLADQAFSTSPYFAKMYADYQCMQDYMLADYLETKVQPARTAAENVRKLAAEKRELLAECKQYEYKVAALYDMFPWMEDYFDFSDNDLIDNTSQHSTEEFYAVDDPASAYLSKTEWSSLTESTRSQLALDRYVQSHKKTKWQIGRDYELFVGYAYTKKGYSVEYPGSLLRLDDMGRDLIAHKGFTTIIIQCKYWSEQKEIHEKHIFQLYGTSICYSMDHPFETVQCLLVTNASFTERARKIAKKIGVSLVSGFQMGEFPRIKCNINSSNEKIYHLPMDQQYDNVVIKNAGEQYAFTVLEAEEAGFRRAYRWNGQ